MEHFDLAIIGSGSGNSLVTPDFEDKRVAIVEAGLFGGTCLNVGCIPTKMFAYAADLGAGATHGPRFGVDTELRGVRWGDIRDRIFGRIDPIEASGRHYRIHGPNTTAFLGRGRFTGERTLAVALNDGGEAELSADQVVIATGSTPTLPPVFADTDAQIHTSDTVMRIEELPERVVIVGGGYIAAEFAHIFSGLGVPTTLVARGELLLRRLDADISARFTATARAQWDLRLGREVTGVRRSAAGRAVLTLDDGSELPEALVLVATGRHPNSADLQLEAAGVRAEPGGRIVVDPHGRTTAPGVWSLGDVSSQYQLKHVANHEARVVAHNLTHPDDLRTFDHRFVPAAVFSEPQIACVGRTEEQLRRAGTSYVCSVRPYGDVAAGWAMEDRTGFAKLLADPQTGLLLGAHLIGPHASTVIQPLIQAMSFGQSARDLARGQYWIHPAIAEVVENALLGLDLT